MHGAFISSGVRGHDEEREEDREREETEARRSKRTPLSRPAGRTPEVKRADTLFIITKLLCAPVPGRVAKRVAGKNCAPATMSALIARPLKRGGHHESPFGACDTRTCLPRAARCNYSSHLPRVNSRSNVQTSEGLQEFNCPLFVSPDFGFLTVSLGKLLIVRYTIIFFLIALPRDLLIET